jgi:hypothetical protein
MLFFGDQITAQNRGDGYRRRPVKNCQRKVVEFIYTAKARSRKGFPCCFAPLWLLVTFLTLKMKVFVFPASTGFNFRNLGVNLPKNLPDGDKTMDLYFPVAGVFIDPINN